MKNKLNHAFIGLFTLLSLTAFAGNKNANQMLHASAKNTYLFEENKGQIKDQNWQPRPDVLFSGEANGLVHHVLANGISYQMTKVESMKPADEHTRKGYMPGDEAEMVPDQIGIYRVDVRWVSSNPNMEIIKSNPSKDYNNYYNVPEGVEPALYVRKYEKITLKNIWQGIDLEYYSKDGVLESDWIVHQASDLDKIKFTIQGADLSIDSEGNLVMQTPYGTIKEGGLKVFQSGKTLEASWKLNGEEVSFSVKNYHPELPIRIDPPTRLWGTYYGGSGGDSGFDIVSDNNFNLLFVGTTYSSTSIATLGVHQTNIGGNNDVFISKFDSSGNRFWGTYYGGSDYEVGWGIVIDKNNNIFITGATKSISGISTVGSYQEIYGGGVIDAFLSKFNDSGNLLWGTYIGGTSGDNAWSIAIDSNENIVLTGWTESVNLPTTTLAHQTNYGGGGYDAFVIKINTLGEVLWLTYYGGTNSDIGNDVISDEKNNIFIIGSTISNNGIATIGSHQINFGGGFNDAFIVKFDSNGNRQWGTYYGGNNEDSGTGIAIDNKGNLLILGNSVSSNSISTIGTHQLIIGDTISGDAFLVKFDSFGNRLWGTYFGGNSLDEVVKGITIDSQDNVLILGTTFSTNNISSIGAYQENYGELADAFIAKFDSNGTFIWGTYYGGEADDYGAEITLNSNETFFIIGYTESYYSIASSGAYQTLVNSTDAFIVKFQDDTTTSVFPETLVPFSSTLFPNPSSEQSYLQILAEKNGEVLFEISDLKGRILSKTSESIIPGENCIQLNVQDFIPGIYFVKLTIDGYTRTLKFCKE